MRQIDMTHSDLAWTCVRLMNGVAASWHQSTTNQVMRWKSLVPRVQMMVSNSESLSSLCLQKTTRFFPFPF